MNNRGPGPAPAGGDDQSALSLLVNAADSRDSPHAATAESLRLRGLAGGASGLGGSGFGGNVLGGGSEPTLEEQLFLQQQAQASYGAGGSQAALLNQLQREQNLLAQLGQQQQLASLLGLGGGGSTTNQDMQRALAVAQLRQSQPQLTNADILALSRSGVLQGLLGTGVGGGYGAASSSAYSGGLGAGAFQGGGIGAYGASQGLASELEGLQRLEELNRRQRLLAATSETSRSRFDGAKYGDSERLEQTDGRAATRNIGAQDQDDLEKSPGSVIVPCRARGMPMDHNFKTAYFVIPENVKHGEELICSYFACRNAGIKFRYCSHCKVPVAKRNFRKRHKHGGETIPVKGEDSVGEEDINKKGIPMQITAGREEAVEADGISSQSADSANQNNDVAEADVQKGLVRNSMRTFETSKNKNKSKISHSGKVSEERQQRWASLLTKRPSTKDSDTMSAWLMEVLAVSDLETPLKLADGLGESTSGKKLSVKKSSGTNDSPRSDIGYGTSSEASGTNNSTDKKEGGEEKPKALGSGVVKKKEKRPLEGLLEEEEDDNNNKSDSYVGGSFAEWKERKKQKKQSKTNGSPGASQE